MPHVNEHIRVPTDAREMHSRIFPGEATQLPAELIFLLASLRNQATASEITELPASAETSALAPLLASLQQETVMITEAMEEQTIARTLLLRFGLPYLPGAEKVWLTLSEYLVDAKKATEQAKLQLRQAVDQIQALLITQLAVDEEKQLQALSAEEEQHRQGITTLDNARGNLVDENQLSTANNQAADQKKQRLTAISAQKSRIKDSIQSMRSVASSLFINFTSIRQFDSAELVMA